MLYNSLTVQMEQLGLVVNCQSNGETLHWETKSTLDSLLMLF